MNSTLRKLPNIITGLRLLVVPFFVLLLLEPTPARNLAAAIVFVVASVSDWLDGYLARRYHAESVLGTMLDPLADKLLVMAALVMLAADTIEPRVPAWIVVVLLSREMIVTGLRSVAAVQGLVVPASRWAKHKTAWTMLAISFLLLRHPYELFGMPIHCYVAGTIFLWLALGFSVITGFAYAGSLRKCFDQPT